MHRQKRIALCNKNSLVRYALKSLLQANSSYTVVAESHDHDSALKIFENHEPEIFVVDTALPGKSGIETIHQVSQKAEKVKILVLSNAKEPEIVKQAFVAGANGYICKDADTQQVVKAVDDIDSGMLVLQDKLEYLREDIVQKLKAPKKELASTHPLEKLSKREKEVFFMLADGQPNRNIAKKMFLSPRTVETHRSRIMKKLGLTSTADIIRYAIKNNLINL